MDLGVFFSAKTIAVVGASRNPNKVGHIIFRNFVDNNYYGKVYPVNQTAEYIVGHKAYRRVTDVPGKLELVVIAVPAPAVMNVVRDCVKKKVEGIVLISAGFEEVGNMKGAEELKTVLNKHKIKLIGPNCLGVFNAANGMDTLFLPRSRLGRPKVGGISFICQSGAVGSAILDLASFEGYGFAKFASYGNATVVDETDLLDYFGDDPDTKVICMYIEGVKDGQKFLETARRVSAKKPVIAIKGGLTERGNRAALSHTGSLGGDAAIYKGAFKQANIIHAEDLEDLFMYAKILEKCHPPKGKRVQIITNGGGYGIITTDEVIMHGLDMAEMSEDNKRSLRKHFPDIVIVKNPMDLLGDTTSERYKLAIDAALRDRNVDIIILIVLMQTPLLGTDVVDAIIELNKESTKPIIAISTGGEFTNIMKRNLEAGGVPTFTYPLNAVKAVAKLVEYYQQRP